MVYKILAIDDDVRILRLIKNTLEPAAYEVTIRDQLEEINLRDFLGFDLILLDIMMPISGLEICRQIRPEVQVPILFLTAKDLSADLVQGVGAGADDYITKPFRLEELLARVQMHLRREERHGQNVEVLDFGEIVLNKATKEVRVNQQLLALTKREFALIEILATESARIFNVEQLYERLYPQQSDTQFRAISEYIYQIRLKFKPHQINPIETLWGGGYKWKIQKILKA